MLRGEFVVGVKQAATIVECDIQLVNPVNYCPRSDVLGRPLVIGTYIGAPKAACDIYLPLKKGGIDQQIARTVAFDEWVLSTRVERPWGPSIMFELGIFLLEHIGAARAVTLGWDLAPEGRHEHFYDPGMVSLQSPEPGEFALLRAASGHAQAWLRSKGCELVVAVRGSYLHDVIPRVELEWEVGARR
jgi:hypothetical protein